MGGKSQQHPYKHIRNMLEILPDRVCVTYWMVAGFNPNVTLAVRFITSASFLKPFGDSVIQTRKY